MAARRMRPRPSIIVLMRAIPHVDRGCITNRGGRHRPAVATARQKQLANPRGEDTWVKTLGKDTWVRNSGKGTCVKALGRRHLGKGKVVTFGGNLSSVVC